MSETLKRIVAHWSTPFPLDGKGWVDLPFDIEMFCRETDAIRAELDKVKTENERLREKQSLAQVGAAHYRGERDIHIKESEVFVKQAVEKIAALRAELEKVKADLAEEHRVNGMGAQRELKLMTELEAARARINELEAKLAESMGSK